MRQPTVAVIAKRLSNIDLGPYEGVYMTYGEVSSYASTVYNACKSSKTLTPEMQTALYNSCQHLEGQFMTKELLKANTLRIVANWHYIAEGVTIPVWDGTQCEAEILFIGIIREQTIKPTHRKVEVKIKTGICAGIITTIILSTKQIVMFLDHEAGVKAFNCAPEEIAGMLADTVIDSRNNALHICQWKCNHRHKQHNKELAEARSDLRKCKLCRPCNTCGNSIEQCNLAVWLRKR